MPIHHLTINGPGWTAHLATILDQAQTGDTIIVPDKEILIVAKSAWKRIHDGRDVRIITAQDYADLGEEFP